MICVGTELLSGKANEYTPIFAEKLKKIGFRLEQEHSVRDDERSIAQAIRQSLKKADAVILCGGLGPTFDDKTREGAALALKRGLKISRLLLKNIEKKFKRHSCPMRGMQKKQAMLIRGGEAVRNRAGSAPGQIIRLAKNNKLIILLPGPLNEWDRMFDNYAAHELKKFFRLKLCRSTAVIKIADMPESAVEEALKPVIESGSGFEFTILAGEGLVNFYATAEAAGKAECADKIRKIRAECVKILGGKIYGGRHESLESAIGKLLLARGWTLSAAESCTGGLISHRLTETPGSSKYFTGTAVAYADRIKKKLLKVRSGTLRGYGAVSEKCAEEMAAGARKLFKTDCALAITGIAGPSGGSPQKPAGTVFAAVSVKGRETICGHKIFSGHRSVIKARAACFALELLRRRLLNT